MQQTLDAIGRRTRAYRQPRGKTLALTQRDLLVLQKLHEHGALPTSYLFEFTKRLGKDYTGFVKRLADLHHEANYLARPWQQFNTMDARHNQLIYGLSDTGEKLLRDLGMWQDLAPRHHSGTWTHDLMVSCITASIEIGAKKTTTRFLPQHEILGISGKGLRVDEIEGHSLVPDAAFGLEYKQEGKKSYRVFLVEADRGTEIIDTQDSRRKSHRRNVTQYRQFVGRGIYKQHFGLSAGMLVLNVTTNTERMRSMMRVIEETSESGRSSFQLYQTKDCFGSYFKPPKPMLNLFTGGWHRAGYEPFHINRPA